MEPNVVNLLNLPTTQVLESGDKIIVQTSIGTRIIDWKNFPVLKLAASGGSYVGTLTGGNINGNTGSFASLSAGAMYSGGQPGRTYATGYYNRLTTVNGLMTSANYVIGSPEYVDIVSTRIPAATAAMSSTFKRQYISYTTPTITISTGTVSGAGSFYTVPEEITDISSFRSSDFAIGASSQIPLSSWPYVVPLTLASGTLTVALVINQFPTSNVSFEVKVSKAY